MAQGRHTAFLHGLGDGQGVAGGVARRAVGDGHKGGLQGGDVRGHGRYLGDAVKTLGRENFTGEVNALVAQKVGNAHGVASFHMGDGG